MIEASKRRSQIEIVNSILLNLVSSTESFGLVNIDANRFREAAITMDTIPLTAK